jgi:hypothetical protein
MSEETRLQKRERHVREAQAHVSRQEHILEKMRQGGTQSFAALTLLRVFKETLRSSQQVLARLRRGYDADADAPASPEAWSGTSYAQKAREAEELANKAGDPTEKAGWEKIAQGYRILAKGRPSSK